MAQHFPRNPNCDARHLPFHEIDSENRSVLEESKVVFPNPIWQGLCWSERGYLCLWICPRIHKDPHSRYMRNSFFTAVLPTPAGATALRAAWASGFVKKHCFEKMWDLQGLTMPNYQPSWGCYKPSQESGHAFLKEITKRHRLETGDGFVLLKLLSPSGSNMPFLMLGKIGGFTKDAIAYYKKSNMATRMCNSHTPLSCLTLHPQTTFPSAFHQNNTHKTKPTENNRHGSQSSHYTDHTEKQTTTTSQQKH